MMYELKATCLYCGAVQTEDVDAEPDGIVARAAEFAKSFAAAGHDAHSRAGGFSLSWAPVAHAIGAGVPAAAAE